MSNAVIDTFVLYITTRVRFVLKVSIQKTKKLFKFGWKILVASSISVLYDEINPLVIGVKYSSADLAFYSKGKSFPNLLNTTFSDTLSAVLFPAMSKVQDCKALLLECTRRYMKVSSFIIFPLMIGFLAVADNFIIVLLTEKWSFATIYLKAFCIVYMFNIIQSGNLQVIRAMGRSDIILILEVIKKSLYFIVIGLFIFLTDSPIYLALACVVNVLLATLINTAPNRKLIGYSYREQIADLALNFIISLIMGVAVYFLGQVNLNMYLLLFLQIVAGIIIYVLLSLMLNASNIKYIIQMIKGFVKHEKEVGENEVSKETN